MRKVQWADSIKCDKATRTKGLGLGLGLGFCLSQALEKHIFFLLVHFEL